MASYPNMTLRGLPRAQRAMRYPKHPFAVSHLPFHICPFFIAPVLPGETLKQLRMQSRAVTDPILNPLGGWWQEYYFFYVKLSDLYEREELREMVINPSWSPSDVTTAQGGTSANQATYYSGGTGMIDYVTLCLRRVVDEFFRDEDDVYSSYQFADSQSRTLPVAKFVGESVHDSVMLTDDETAQDVTLLDAATTDTLTASEVDTGMRLWQQQRLYGLTELSYEDWLSSFGIAATKEEDHRPELIRYIREWSYPTNTIDPTNGTARSAVSWTISERADKARTFREPGFLFGVTLTRPKIFRKNQEGTFTSLLNDFRSFLPAIFAGDPMLSWKTVDTAAGPLQTVVTDAQGYRVDLKDLYLYGEQFNNRGNAVTNASLITSANAALTNCHYPQALADIDALFVTTGTNLTREDGVVELAIASAPVNPLRDTSPRGGNRSGETSGGF